MQTKPEDRPKIIGLIIGIVVILIIAAARLIPALAPKDTASTVTNPAANPATGSGTPAAAPIGTGTVIAGAGNPGQMRRFDDTIDTDAPVSVGASFGGHTDAFRTIAAPIQIAKVEPQVTRSLPTVKTRPIPNFPPIPAYNPPPQTVAQMVAAPPLEVTLDGVYQAGQERVAQLTIALKNGGKEGSGKLDQTVYRRVGEYIGRFRIARLTESGLILVGQSRPWTVGAMEKLDEGQIPAPRNSVASPARALPILLPR